MSPLNGLRILRRHFNYLPVRRSITKTLLQISISNYLPFDHAYILRGDISRNRRSRKVLPPADKIPEHTDTREAGPHDTRIVHGRRGNRDSDGEAEQDDGERDPDQSEHVNDEPEPAERKRRVLDRLPAAQHRDQDRQAVGSRQADCRDAGETVERGRGAEVDESQEAVDDGREDERPQWDAEARVHASPEVRARDRAVARERVRASARSGEGADAGEEEDAEEEEEQAESACRGTRHGCEEQADRLPVGHAQQHLDVRQHEQDRDQVDDACYAGRGDG